MCKGTPSPSPNQEAKKAMSVSDYEAAGEARAKRPDLQ